MIYWIDFHCNSDYVVDIWS